MVSVAVRRTLVAQLAHLDPHAYIQMPITHNAWHEEKIVRRRDRWDGEVDASFGSSSINVYRKTFVYIFFLNIYYVPQLLRLLGFQPN
jgi:hypothetical protein